MMPSLVLIFLVLGTIFMGLATPTEAGAMGAVGAIVLAVLHGRYTHGDDVVRDDRPPCGSPRWWSSS